LPGENERNAPCVIRVVDQSGRTTERSVLNKRSLPLETTWSWYEYRAGGVIAADLSVPGDIWSVWGLPMISAVMCVGSFIIVLLLRNPTRRILPLCTVWASLLLAGGLLLPSTLENVHGIQSFLRIVGQSELGDKGNSEGVRSHLLP